MACIKHCSVIICIVISSLCVLHKKFRIKSKASTLTARKNILKSISHLVTRANVLNWCERSLSLIGTNLSFWAFLFCYFYVVFNSEYDTALPSISGRESTRTFPIVLERSRSYSIVLDVRIRSSTIEYVRVPRSKEVLY